MRVISAERAVLLGFVVALAGFTLVGWTAYVSTSRFVATSSITLQNAEILIPLQRHSFGITEAVSSQRA